MKLKIIVIVTIFMSISIKLTNCVPMGDIDDERDVNFLINKIKEAITKESSPASPSPSPSQEKTSPIEKVLKNSDEANVIRFDSKGDSIESEKLKLNSDGGGCKDKAKSLVTEHAELSPKNIVKKNENENITEVQKENLHDISSSVDDHAIRYDRHGDTFEEYKETDEHHDDHNESSEEKPKKKKKTLLNKADIEGDDTINLNSILNDEFINKQLENKKPHDDDDSEDEDDDIPLITIPMYDILRQFQRMQQGFESETEEYSEETTQDVFDDPHLKNILREISAERKAMKNVVVDGKKIKPAAKRVFERHFGPSDESL
ncbi:M protein, serotype 5-like [Chironomus tepperi]|uniref:M protein, serotype 5-like n=1 Tax=Chironomus tepperi TaxID=113505 RepID=UPI00391F48E7